MDSKKLDRNSSYGLKDEHVEIEIYCKISKLGRQRSFRRLKEGVEISLSKESVQDRKFFGMDLDREKPD